MNEPKTGSKRQALRFIGNAHPVCFKTEFENGHGVVADISGRGCAIAASSLPLARREKILIIMDLEDADDIIEIGARVVRDDGGNIGVQFIHLSDDNRQRIVKYFAAKQRSA